MSEVKIFETIYRLIEKTIDDLVQLSNSQQKEIHWVLSGGSTPKAIFKALAEEKNKSKIAWDKLHFWWADERCVPWDDPESNYGDAKKLLLDHLDISPDQIHPVNGSLTPDQSVIDYIRQIKTNVVIGKNGFPIFDLIWLGMGDDGHTASLFAEHFSHSDQSWAVVAHHPKTHQSRVTLTLPVINNAKEVYFIVTGESKAEMLKRILSGTDVSLIYPAANIKPLSKKLIWYVDREAASLLR